MGGRLALQFMSNGRAATGRSEPAFAANALLPRPRVSPELHEYEMHQSPYGNRQQQTPTSPTNTLIVVTRASTSSRALRPGSCSSFPSYRYYHVCVPADEMQMCRDTPDADVSRPQPLRFPSTG